MLMDLFIPRRDDEVEESLAGFVRRRLGREALDRLVQPLVAGIYTADPNNLSLKATLPQFLAMERDHRQPDPGRPAGGSQRWSATDRA